MTAFSDIIERIKDIIGRNLPNQKILDRDVAQSLGIRSVTLASMKKRNSIPYEEILLFCAKNKISINWLFFNQNPESLVESTNRYSYVRYLQEIHASAGGGADNTQVEEENLMLEERFARQLGTPKDMEHIEAIRVSGDSMEPLLHDSDIVFVDRKKTEFRRGGVFVINTPHGVFIKRLQQRLDGKIDVISDNRDYPVQELSPDEMNIIGQVVGRFGAT